MIGARRLAQYAPGVQYAALGVFLVAAGALAATRFSPSDEAVPVSVRPAASHPAAFFDDRQFAQSLALAEAAPAEPMTDARAVIIPHHWVGGHLILGALRDLAAAGTYDRIILVGPNHTNAGGAPITTSDLAWETPFGVVSPDPQGLAALPGDVPVSVAPDVLTYEHSIAGIVPAVAYYLPGAAVLPLVFDASISPNEVERLAAALAGLMDERTILIAAVDFSHYLPAEQARLRDAESLDALSGVEASRVMTFGNEHMDSPASIALVMEVVQRLGATEFHLLENADSSEVTGGFSGSVTSYVSGYYR